MVSERALCTSAPGWDRLQHERPGVRAVVRDHAPRTRGP